MLDNIFIQLAMGAAALITFLGSLSLLGAVNQYIMAKANKIKAETAFLVATAKKIRPGKNGGTNV